MKIKVSFISTSFDNNIYPRGVACVECTIQTKDSEVSYMYIRKAEENTLESFVENDNLCQKMAIQQTLKIIKYIENHSTEDIILQDKRSNLYKNKVIELINLSNWNVEKLARFVQKYSKKRLNDLTESDWAKIYEYLLKNINRIDSEKINNTEAEIIKPEEWEEII
ncbi:MAG: hypothetical protein RMJ51_02165 [Candidatus Calescibacterium sp.]|nr:hypothetical protein [Candidatus Calescibacterium sp.]MCX7971866.1 hypothetical protein [bacterium]MDW8195035.1 hypothetical protein [Candidatus Calescibacterium sp.]